MRMVVLSVLASLAFTELVAGNTHVKALTVLLLALSLLACAAFLDSPINWVVVRLLESVLGDFSSLFYCFLVFTVVHTVDTSTFRATRLPIREAFTVHLEAACLFTATATFLGG